MKKTDTYIVENLETKFGISLTVELRDFIRKKEFSNYEGYRAIDVRNFPPTMNLHVEFNTKKY